MTKKSKAERTIPMRYGCDLVAFGLCDILGHDRREDDPTREAQRENLKAIWVRFREMKQSQLKHTGRDHDDHWETIERRLKSSVTIISSGIFGSTPSTKGRSRRIQGRRKFMSSRAKR